MIAAMILSCTPAHATPVFDCADPKVRQQYPAMCPGWPGDPLLTPGTGEPPTGGGGGNGLLSGILHHLGL